jgi:hypothetical protein
VSSGVDALVFLKDYDLLVARGRFCTKDGNADFVIPKRDGNESFPRKSKSSKGAKKKEAPSVLNERGWRLRLKRVPMKRTRKSPEQIKANLREAAAAPGHWSPDYP